MNARFLRLTHELKKTVWYVWLESDGQESVKRGNFFQMNKDWWLHKGRDKARQPSDTGAPWPHVELGSYTEGTGNQWDLYPQVPGIPSRH